MTKKKHTQAVGKSVIRRQKAGRPALPPGTVQMRVTFEPGVAEKLIEAAEKAGLPVPRFIGIAARNGMPQTLNALLGIPQMEEAV